MTHSEINQSPTFFFKEAVAASSYEKKQTSQRTDIKRHENSSGSQIKTLGGDIFKSSREPKAETLLTVITVDGRCFSKRQKYHMFYNMMSVSVFLI